MEPALGPECLCGSCTRFCQGSPARGAAWPWWPPVLCASAPASAAPESLVGRGRWMFPGIRFWILGHQVNEGFPGASATPLPASASCAMGPGVLGWGSCEVAYK